MSDKFSPPHSVDSLRIKAIALEEKAEEGSVTRGREDLLESSVRPSLEQDEDAGSPARRVN